MALVKRLRRDLLNKPAEIEESGDRSEFFEIYGVQDVYGLGIFTIFIRGSEKFQKGSFIEVEALDEFDVPLIVDVPPSSEVYEKRFLPSRRMTIKIDDQVGSGIARLIFYGTLKDGNRVRYVRTFTINKESNTQLLVDKGDWKLNDYYEIANVVQYSGSSYKTILSHEALESTAPPDPTYWTPFAESEPTYQLLIESAGGYTIENKNNNVYLTASFFSSKGETITSSLDYQWYKTGSIITDATGSNYIVTPSQVNGSTQFGVEVLYENRDRVRSYQTVNEITDGIALVYQGLYDSTRTYIRNENIVEVVFLDSTSMYYAVRTGINEVPENENPENNSTYWTEVPSFKILATDLLLAQDVTIRRSLTLGDADIESEYGGKGIIKSLGGYDVTGSYTTIQNDIDSYGFYVDTSGSLNLGGNLKWNPITQNLDIKGSITLTGGNVATTSSVNDVSSSLDSSINSSITNLSSSLNTSFNNSIDGVSSSFDSSLLDTSSSLALSIVSNTNEITSTSSSFASTSDFLDSKIFTDENGKLNKTPSTSSDGLYLGDTHLGYYSGSSWITYMDNQGDFYLTGSDGFLTWDSTNSYLAIKGDIVATNIVTTSGSIAGWNLTNSSLYKGETYLSSSANGGGLIIQDSNQIPRISVGDFETSSTSSDNLSTPLTYILSQNGGINLAQNPKQVISEQGTSNGSMVLTASIDGTVGEYENIFYRYRFQRINTIASYNGTFEWVLNITTSLYDGATQISDSIKTTTIGNYEWYGGDRVLDYTYTNGNATSSNMSVRVEFDLDKNGHISHDSNISIGYNNISTYIYKSVISITPEQALFYTNDSNYFEWTKNALTLRSENFEVDNITVSQNAVFAGNTVISGSAVILGQLTVEGDVDSHMVVSGATTVDNNDGSAIQDLTFDTFGHVTQTNSYNFDGRYYKKGDADAKYFNKSTGDTVTGSSTFNGSVTVNNNMTISGSLTVLGDTFSASVETVEITDNILVVNHGETGDGITSGFAGIEVDRGSSNSFWFVADENRGGKFAVGESGSTQLVATRQNSPTNNGVPYWNSGSNRFDTSANIIWANSMLNVAGEGQFKKITVDNNSTNGILNFDRTNVNQAQIKFDTSNSDFIISNHTGSLKLATSDNGSATNRLRIDGNGNFGFNIAPSNTWKYNILGSSYFDGKVDIKEKLSINTTASLKNLTIGSTNTETNLYANGMQGGDVGTGLLIYNYETGSGIYSNIDFRSNTADGRIAFVYNSTNNGDFHFLTDDNTLTTPLIIKHNGNILMGQTTNDSYKLQVNGKIKSNNDIISISSDAESFVTVDSSFTGSNRNNGLLFKDQANDLFQLGWRGIMSGSVADSLSLYSYSGSTWNSVWVVQNNGLLNFNKSVTFDSTIFSTGSITTYDDMYVSSSLFVTGSAQIGNLLDAKSNVYISGSLNIYNGSEEIYEVSSANGVITHSGSRQQVTQKILPSGEPEVVSVVAIGSGYDTAFFDYSIRSGSNFRAGTIVAVTDENEVEHYEESTVAKGYAGNVQLNVVLDGGTIHLIADADNHGWEIKCIVRSI